MRRTTLLAAVLLLAGCGSGDDDASTASSSTTSASSSSSSASAASTTSAAPSVAKPAVPARGTEVKTSFGSVTYFGQKRPAAPNAPAPEQSGTEWVAIDVQLCLDAAQQGGNVNNSSWTVQDSGNGQNDPSGIGYEQFPAPEYPFQTYISPGSCIRGWITYSIVAGRPLTTVRYLSESVTTPIIWAA